MILKRPCLLGKSTEWLKAIESGRLLQPRLPMLLTG